MSNLETPLQPMPTKSSCKHTVLFFVGGLLLGSIIAAGFFMNRAKHQASSTADVTGENLFKIDGTVYTNTTLPRMVQMNFFSLSKSIYDAKSHFLNQVALRIALAKDNPSIQAASSDDLPPLDKLLNISPVSDEEADSYYNSIIGQYGKGVFGDQPLDAIKPQIKLQLMRQKIEQTTNAKMQEFVDSGRIQSFLVAPEAPPVQLNLTGYPIRGNKNANITLVEVADYMCPHCRETEPVIEKIYKKFENKVKFVYVSFPLNPEGLSGALARGAFCANQQGNEQFWDYHKNAFQVSWNKVNPPKETPAEKFFNDEAVAVADQSKLDMQAFNNCLNSDDAKNHLDRLKNEFTSDNGFKGTPTFYLNDRLVQASPAQLEDALNKSLNQLTSK